MDRMAGGMVLALLLSICLDADAETYKCVRGGQTVFSDLPCAASATRVDGTTDKVSREQRRQAEAVSALNRQQLHELEYQAARDRNTPRRVVVLPQR